MTRSCFSLDMDTFNQTKEAIRNDPKLGQGSFVAVTEWTDGSMARTTARSFTIETDEPAMLAARIDALTDGEFARAKTACAIFSAAAWGALDGVYYTD